MSWLELFQYAFLGVIQGFTEFLPISSSGHLALFHRIFGLSAESVSFDVMVHLASLCAVIIFFRKDIWRIATFFFKSESSQEQKLSDKKSAYFIILATALTAVFGFFFKDIIESFFSVSKVVSAGWLFTAILLFIADKKINLSKRPESSLRVSDALVVGFFQSLALIPGISRSGSTISSALIKGIEKETAVRLSFLLAIPAILGAVVLKLNDLSAMTINPIYIWAGFLSAFVSAVLALKILVFFIRNLGLKAFAVYCFLLSLATFVLVK